MLAIKLRGVGKKHQRSFRIVVMEKRSKLQGRFVEDLGWFDPASDKFQVNAEATRQWIQNGAQPTDTVHNLLVRGGVVKGPKIPVHKKAKAKTTTDGGVPQNAGKEEVKPAAEVAPVPDPSAESESAAA